MDTHNIMQVIASILFIFVIMFLILAQTDQVRENRDASFGINVTAAVFIAIALLIYEFTRCGGYWDTENLLQIAASAFFVMAIFFLVIAQSDQVRENPDGAFGVNVTSGVLAALGAMIALITVMM